VTISIHCVELEELEIHFNTRQMAAHLEEMATEEEEEEERSQMCGLKSLGVHGMPLVLAALEEEVCDGLWNIFPSLECITRAEDSKSDWGAISKRMFPGRTHGEEQTEN